ncbi:MAG: hypothetical protein ACPGOV_04770 [Magnetovibrionaceae bacterium]
MTAAFRSLARGRESDVEAQEIRDRANCATGTLVDLGTGDGAYPYRFAKENPDWLAIGIDAAAENLTKTAARIGAKPAKGGVSNLLLLVSPVEKLAGLDQVADRLAVNFPWGSLQRGLVAGEAEILGPARSLMKPGGTFSFWLNLQVFADNALRDRLELPDFNEAYLDGPLRKAYEACGFRIEDFHRLEEGAPDVRTTWGQKLTLGSRRETFQITGVAA